MAAAIPSSHTNEIELEDVRFFSCIVNKNHTDDFILEEFPLCRMAQHLITGHFWFWRKLGRLVSFISNLYHYRQILRRKKKGEGNGCCVVTKVSVPWQGRSCDLPLPWLL